MNTLSCVLPAGVARVFLLALLTLGWMLAGVNSLAATISWSGGGGDGLWSNPTNWNGGGLPTSADDVVIDVPGDETIRMDVYNTSIRSLQCQESFIVQTGPFSLTAGASVVNGTFTLLAYQSLGVEGAATTFTVNGAMTNLTGQWHATAGAVIALPTAGNVIVDGQYINRMYVHGAGSAINLANLTNIVVNSGYGFQLQTYEGGRIDASNLRATDGYFIVGANGEGSLVNLTSLTGRWTAGPSGYRISLSAADGGTVAIPNVTALDGVEINLNGSGNIPTAQIRSFTGGMINFQFRTNGLQGLTNFSGFITAYDTRLDLTNITALYATNGDTRLYAYQGSVIDLSRVTNGVATGYFALQLNASDGSRINLSGLPVPEGSFLVDARGAGSRVDLAGFVGEWGGYGSVRAWDGASVWIPNVTTMSNLALDLRAEAVVPTAQLRSLNRCYITLERRTNGFTGLTNFVGSTFAVTDTRLDLTNFTVLHATNYPLSFTAYQDSFIDLSRVTNVVAGGGYGMYVYAQGGSRIDLSRLAANAPVSIDAHGAGSFIDLSGLSGEWAPALAQSLRAWDGATILVPNITAMKRVSLDLSGSPAVLAQLQSFTDGTLTLRTGTNGFAALTNFTGSLAATDATLYLTNLTTLYVTNRVDIKAEQGGRIDLSHVTNVTRNGYSLNLMAYGGGRIDLSGLRVPDEGPLTVEARHEGSLVDLSGFSGLWDAPGSVWVSAWRGSAVAVSKVTAMRGVSLDLVGDANVPVAQLHSLIGGSVRLQERTNVFSALTNFASSLVCDSFGRAEFPGLKELNTASNYVSFTARSGSFIDLTQVTNAVAEPHGLGLIAQYGGRIEIPNLETIVAGTVSVQAVGADAVVDLSGLTGFFSDNNGGSLSTSSGGVILLNGDALLLAGVAIDLEGNPGGVLPPFLAPSQSLVLYGQPWQSYRIEARNALVAGSPWLPYLRVPLTTSLQILGPRPPANLVLRVRTFVADPPELGIRRPSAGVVETILYGVPGRSYRLESKTSVGSPGGWENSPMITLTNSFAINPGANATNSARFQRARAL